MLFAIIFSESSSSSSVAIDSDFDAKVFRHNLMRSKNYNQKGFGHKDETLELMNREYTSDIIKTIPLLIILIVRTRLEVVITRRGLVSSNENDVTRGTFLMKPHDDSFRFGRPEWLLHHKPNHVPSCIVLSLSLQDVQGD